ncbi:hypothetical protein GTO10_06420 [Candidatus Saccharibacteria bacterium]|nr:hypothetical protein [Candidatus Saccharibacteria bacterium]
MRALFALVLFIALGGCAPLSSRVVEYSPALVPRAVEDMTSVQDGTTQAALPVDVNYVIAVLPFQNLSGKPAPLKELRKLLINNLEEKGLRFLDDSILEDFMKRYRIRHTGGISRRVAELLKKETGADAVLITFIELYKEEDPPKIAVTSRLVVSGEQPRILWMESSALTGDESPGLLGLGLIKDRKVLVEKAFLPLEESLARYVTGVDQRPVSGREKNKQTSLPYYAPALHPGKVYSRYAPKTYYQSPVFPADRKYTVAVVPFYDISSRKGAGEIMAYHFVEQLLKVDNLNVIEPGVVRYELLKYRVILDTGVSLADADILFDKLGADLVVSGRVFDYQGFLGVPKVDFSVEIIEHSTRKTVWSSRSYNRGDEGVYFFDIGRVPTAQALTSRMVLAVTEKLFERKGKL